VKIYLPRFTGPLEEPVGARPALREPLQESAFKGMAALVVEDDERMRTFAVEAFRELGFEVASAQDSVSALRLVDARPNLRLLFTDIVMPDMNGRALATEACRRIPELKVIYTTGFSRNAVIHNGVLDDGVNFLAKPFTFDQLAAKLHAVLGA
jgi:DNA-binding NtrC family response regulator